MCLMWFSSTIELLPVIVASGFPVCGNTGTVFRVTTRAASTTTGPTSLHSRRRQERKPTEETSKHRCRHRHCTQGGHKSGNRHDRLLVETELSSCGTSKPRCRHRHLATGAETSPACGSSKQRCIHRHCALDSDKSTKGSKTSIPRRLHSAEHHSQIPSHTHRENQRATLKQGHLRPRQDRRRDGMCLTHTHRPRHWPLASLGAPPRGQRS